MADTAVDLISMADIARLAGQSRATVGNWKRRESDFPDEVTRGPRRPLYDRAVIEAWLVAKGRLETRNAGEFELFRITDRIRGDATLSEVNHLLLVLIGLRTVLGDKEWSHLATGTSTPLDGVLHAAVNGALPFAEVLLPRGPVEERMGLEAVAAVAHADPSRLPDAAESLIDALYDGRGGLKSNGGTPQSLRSLMVALAGQTGSVYDPTVGTGQLLVDAARHSEGPTPDLFGQEISEQAWAVARLNLVIHGLDARIELGPVLLEDHLRDLRADRVVAHPPWNIRLDGPGVVPDDPRWIWGDLSYGDANMAWVQHCVYHLADAGRAVLALPPKVLFDKSRASKAMQGIIKSGYLDAVISLPAGLLPATGLQCAVLVFVKGRPLQDGRPAPTMMVNVEEDLALGTGRMKSLGTDLIDELVELYDDWRAGERIYSLTFDVEFVDYEDLAANDFDLSPRRYAAPQADEVDSVALAEAHRTLTSKVTAAFAACRRADTALLELLNEDR